MPATRTYSTNQGTSPATSLLVSGLNEKAKLLNVEGYCNGVDSTTQYYLQLFALAAVPANGTVPLRSLQVLGTDGFRFNYNDIGLTTTAMAAALNSGNLLFVLSTTEATLTIGTGSVTMDLSVEVEEYEFRIAGLQSVTESGSGYLLVWTQATGAAGEPRLYRIRATNVSADDFYLHLAARDIGASHLLPGGGWLVPATSDHVISFGDTGICPVEQTTDGTIYRACNVCVTTVGYPYYRNSAGVLINTALRGATGLTLTAYYK